jgi:hypothetical protein
MQNYLCKRLHSDCRKLPISYGKSISYGLILDKKYTILNACLKGYFLQKSYNY